VSSFLVNALVAEIDSADLQMEPIPVKLADAEGKVSIDEPTLRVKTSDLQTTMRAPNQVMLELSDIKLV